MLELLLKVTALGIASTASPGILAVSLSILASRMESVRRLAALLAGGVLAVLLIALAGSQAWGGSLKFTDALIPYTDLLSMVLGTLFIAVGLYELVHRDAENKQRFAVKKLWRLFVIGFLINITNFDAVLLNLAAVRQIASAGLGFLLENAYIVYADMFYLAPSLLPLAVYVIAPERAERTLEPIGIAMRKYGRFIVAAVFLVFGALILLRMS
ncbi:Sap, sulfolipid-1-addressing protein [Candidatus Norongarragalina meridionalis]|nr:Sap, sulfolipid-1-addressing protein [Candidatus Norongarragalina meridionalis]